MKKTITLLAFLSFLGLNAQSLYFPPLTGKVWDTLSPTSLGWCQNNIDSLLDYLGKKDTKAFILLKDGKIVIEKYYGTFTQDSTWYWASAGKSLTAFTVGIAQQEGHLSIHDTTSKYLGNGWTACPPAKEAMITVRNQLTMTSGLDDGVIDNSCTIDTCLQYLADPGTRWAYHNGPYTLLDSVIFHATGLSLNAYVTQKVKIPTGMTGAYISSDYNNVFYSKPRSMARYGLLILNKGNWNGNQVMTDTTYFKEMVNTSQNFNKSYGYLWWLNGKSSFKVPTIQTTFPGSLNTSAPNDMFAALGKNGQIINVVPSMNLVYIRMGNSPGSGGLVSVAFNDTIWQKLNAVMCNTTSIAAPLTTQNQLAMYPNPFSSQATLRLDNAIQKGTISVYNSYGQLVKEMKNISGKAFTIERDNLASGLYFVRLTTDNKTIATTSILVND